MSRKEVYLVCEEKHVREEIFEKFFKRQNIRFKKIYLFKKIEKSNSLYRKNLCLLIKKIRRKKIGLLIYCCLNSNHLISNFPRFPKIKKILDIYDPKDLINNTHEDAKNELKICNQFDLIACRDPRLNILAKKLHYKSLKNRMVYLPDLLSNEIRRAGKIKQNKIVSVGWIDGIFNPLSELNKIISCFQKPLDIIPSKFQLNEIKKQTKFKVIVPRTKKAYLKEIQKYKYGFVQPPPKGCDGQYIYSDWYRKNASSSRLSDYLNYNLTPLIPKENKYQIWFAKKSNKQSLTYETVNGKIKIKKNKVNKDSKIIILSFMNGLQKISKIYENIS